MVEEIMGSTLLKMGRKGVFCIFGDSLSPCSICEDKLIICEDKLICEDKVICEDKLICGLANKLILAK
jgi:hypothetical protein